MSIRKLTERVWMYPFEEERDRPVLCYIHGDRWNLAVDAGHSDEHVMEFYRALEDNGLPLPDITVLTHWHWDHTFGMHSVHGLCLANEKTNAYLKEFRDRIEKEGAGFFLALDESIRKEYKDGKPVIVTLSDMVYSKEMLMDLGNCHVRIFEADSPHTDDSTLVLVPEDKVLVLGDSICGEFPEWTVDPVPAGKLAETIRKADAKICVAGHWDPLPPETIIRDMLAGT